MTTDSFMSRYGARLADSGYSILPIAPGTKAPGKYQGGCWRGYVDWSRHCDRPTKPFETGIWAGWPGAGIGVACGRIVALDIDVLNAEAVERIEALAKQRLGDTPAIRIGLAPKRLLVYRAAKPFKSIKRHPLELLAHGAQFVAYADHPDTGRPYSWPYDSLVDLQFTSLPEITEDQARAFMDEAWELVPQELRRATLRPSRGVERYYHAGGDLVGTPEAVQDALAYIPNDDLDYDSWIRIGLAIKAAVGAVGEGLFGEWSRRASKSGSSGKSDTPERVYDSFKPHSIGAGTIYQLAEEHGWHCPTGMTMNGTLAALAEVNAEQGHPAAGMLAKLNGQGSELRACANSQTEPNACLSFVDAAPGLLGDMVRWMTATAVSPQPFLALGASLAALGVLAGHRYRLDRPDTRSNVYILALADSGAGKDHPRRCIRRAFQDADLTAHLGGEQIKSGSGLMVAVTEQPRLLYQIDEFGHFVKAVLDQKSRAYHLREIMTNFTTLWSSSTERVRGAEYANRKDHPRRDIVEPCVAIYSSTVPRTFWDAIGSGTISDGSLARFLVFQSPENYPDEQEPADITDGLDAIVEWLKVTAAGIKVEGNLAGHVLAPYVVPLDQSAMDVDTTLRAEHLELKRSYEGTPYSAIVARYREHIRRIALIAAVADNPLGTVCTADHMAWAWALVRYCQATILDQAERFTADSEYEALQKRALEIIRRSGKWLDGRELSVKLRFIPVKQRNDMLRDLADMRLLEAREEKTSTKTRLLVRSL